MPCRNLRTAWGTEYSLKGSAYCSDRDFTIATVAAPTVMVEEVEEEEVELGEDGEPLDGETPAVEGEEADASTDTEESEPN